MTGVNRHNPRRPVVRPRPLEYERVPRPQAEDDEPLWRDLVGRLALFLIAAILCGVGTLLIVTTSLPLILLGSLVCVGGLLFLAGAVLPRRWMEPAAAALGRVGEVLGSLLNALWWW